MVRTQLNINIDPLLMERLKEGAIKSGKTISEFVAESISNQLANQHPVGLESKLFLLEKRLNFIEEHYLDGKCD